MLKNPPVKPAQKDWPEPGQWTYSDYQRLPEDGRYELISGVLYEMAPPTILHQMIVANLLLLLGQFIKDRGWGILLPSPLEVILSSIATPVQPDLVFIRTERREIIKQQRIEGAPDLIIEVLSPSTVSYDRRTKFDAYEQAAVPEYWIVNPKGRTVEIYQLHEEEYTLAGEYAAAEEISSPSLGQLNMTPDGIFETVSS
jgi:Uma2 family endonuclease